MLCASNVRQGVESEYRCHAIDIEHGGKPKARYLGNNGEIRSFSTSKGDPNVFVTCADDGFVRMYDQRQSLPVYTIKGSYEFSGDNIPTAVLCHPDSIPFLFVGSDKEECVKLWDLRFKQPVYRLATGNNAVLAMAWNDEKDGLFAVTECLYITRHGDRADYRPAKVPPKKDQDSMDVDRDEDDEEEDEGPYEEYVDDTRDRQWPKRAFHAENYFEHLFDSGRHGLLRYSFKENSDRNTLPGW